MGCKEESKLWPRAIAQALFACAETNAVDELLHFLAV